jgi:putative phosphonate metabolism protein
MTARYAIYFAPALHSPWWQFGSQWLGRDEHLDQLVPQTLVPQMNAGDLQRLTSHPRHYGFHATLKAPFGLRENCTADDLQERMRVLARTLRPVALGPMHATALGNFVALVPVTPPAALAALANSCVTELDDLRRPLSDEDMARRKSDKLDTRGLELLHRYGYPLVMERFQFHFSLTGPVTAPNTQQVLMAVHNSVDQLNTMEPLVLDRLCLFVEPASGQPLVRVADVGLADEFKVPISGL